MATEAVALEPFMKVSVWDSVRLCTELTGLAGDDAAAEAVDASVLAAAPVPEGSLMPVDEFASRVPGADGPDIGSSPRVLVRIVCRDPRIGDAVEASLRRDPETRARGVFVWVFHITNPDGITLDYRFRARLAGEMFYEESSGRRVVSVFLDVLDRRPTVTEPRVVPPRPSPRVAARACAPGPNPAG